MRATQMLNLDDNVKNEKQSSLSLKKIYNTSSSFIRVEHTIQPGPQMVDKDRLVQRWQTH